MMSSVRSRWAERPTWLSLGLGIGMLLASFGVTRLIVSGDASSLIAPALGVALAAIALVILSDWRAGIYLFLFWLVFEDLPRKYLGNSMVIYLGKDLLAAIAYLSFFWAIRRSHGRIFRPPFWVPLLLFSWLGLLQVFNPNSPHLIYGLLGVKLYLYYIPLMFLGYAMVNSPENLERFLVFNLALAGIVALLGITQTVVGLDFLNPATLAPELVPLGQLVRYAPISRVAVAHPTSVFVSTGRFASYMQLMFLLGLGALLAPQVAYRSRKFVSLGTGLVAVATFLSGSRGAFLTSLSSAFVVVAASLWANKRGASRGHPAYGSKSFLMTDRLKATSQYWRERPRLISAAQRALGAIGVAILCMLLLYPRIFGARWAFYYETLSPESPYFEVGRRVWDYPIQNFRNAFYNPNWPIGEGIGTGSLGTQYVAKYFGLTPRIQMLESGYGTLLVEMGILGLVLWLVWTLALIRACWKIVRALRDSAVFPLAFAIFWFVFLLLIPSTYGGIQSYQNFILNAYLWLLVGILFGLGSVGTHFSGGLTKTGF